MPAKVVKKPVVINSFDRFTKFVIGIAIVLIVAILFYTNLRPTSMQSSPKISPSDQESSYKNELVPANSAVALPTSYTIVSGDTLWSIAENYYSSGFNWIDIKFANPQINPTMLTIGDKITIPNVPPKSITKGVITPTVTLSKITTDSYEVLPGDSLWQISLRAYGDAYRWVDIAKANNLVNPNLIHKGNVLIIPR